MFIGNLSYVHVAIVIVLDVFNSTVREINIFKLNLFSSYSSIKAHPSVDQVFLKILYTRQLLPKSYAANSSSWSGFITQLKFTKSTGILHCIRHKDLKVSR